MKSALKLTCVAVAIAGLLTVSAQATPISGSISIGGSANFADNTNTPVTNLANATQITSFNTALVTNGQGAYAGTFGDSVTYTPFSFNPSSAPVSSLWTFVDTGHAGATGWTYSLDLSSLSIYKQTSTDLILNGSGALHITGSGSPYATTNGSWRFSVNDSSGGTTGSYTFGFTSSDSSPIPDAGATGLLLGLGLVSVGFAARRSLRKQA